MQAILTRGLGVLAAMLPRRWWPWLDEFVPASSSALAASLLTLLAGAAVGIPGFLDYVGYTSDANAGAALQAVEQNMLTRPDLDNAAALRHMAVSLNALALFMFLFATPLGLLTSYLGLSGLIRTAGALCFDPHGDFALTIVDGLARRGRAARHAAVERRRRQSLEGREFPDRLISGAQAGIAGCDLVLVCSRCKPGWDAGTVVLSDEGVFRVGRIEERTMGGWLRTLYPLYPHEDQEAFRRTVHYNLPKRS